MIQLYCGRKGSGKTKALINLANEKVQSCEGTMVYIDDDKKMFLELDRKLRFISTDEYNLEDYSEFYGLLCGIVCQDYDIEAIFVDGLLNIVGKNIIEAERLIDKLEKLFEKSKVELHINASIKGEEVPEFLKKYLAN